MRTARRLTYGPTYDFFFWGGGGSANYGPTYGGAGLPAHGIVGRQTPLWTECQTRVKTLPCPILRMRAVKIHRHVSLTAFDMLIYLQTVGRP